MADRYLIVDRLKLSYEGLFNVSELYTIIATWFREKGYDWYEKMNEEQVTPQGKQIRLVLQPEKNVSDYYKIVIRVKLNMINVKEVEVEHEGVQLRLHQGVVRLLVDGFLIADRKGKWEKKPIRWFLSILSQKYFYRDHYLKHADWVQNDVDEMHHQIKNYLNVFKYTYQK